MNWETIYSTARINFSKVVLPFKKQSQMKMRVKISFLVRMIIKQKFGVE